MRVLVEGEWGVLEGTTLEQRAALQRELNTTTSIVGDRFKFVPSRDALEHIRTVYSPEFDTVCRTAWGHFYKRRQVEEVDFAFKSKPYQHQYDVWLHCRDMQFFGLLWEMGLGKTKTALDVAAWKYSTGQIDAMLVITLKGVHRNWVMKEIPEHLSIPCEARAWNSNRVEAGMRGLVDHAGFAVATINFDVTHRKSGQQFIRRFLSTRKAHIVIDESHGIKTPTAERTKAAHKFAPMAKSRMILTGTFATNSPLDAWAQLHFLSPKILEMENFWQFRAYYAVMQELPGVTHLEWRRNKQTGKSYQVEVPTKIVVGFANQDELKQRMAPFISRLVKEDVLDLPEKVYRQQPFELTEPLRKAYAKMKKDLVIELADSKRVTAQLAITMLLRLQQIACGFATPDGRDPEALCKENPRMEALADVLEQAAGKAIIWAHYKFSLDEIEAFLAKTYGKDSLVSYRGETSDDDRELAVKLFQDPESKVRWFVGQPRAGGTGITLTEARDVIYYNNSFDLGIRLQSEDRAHRIGQTRIVTYTDILALDTIDERLLTVLREKRDMAAELTGDELRAWIGD